MDLRGYLELLRRRWWLFVLGPLLASAGAFAVTSKMTPTYQANTTVLVKPVITANPAPGGDFFSFERFSNTYAALITSPNVLQSVIDELNLPMTTTDLSARLSVNPSKTAELIDISVKDSDPQRATRIANSLVQSYIDNSPAQASVPGSISLLQPANVPTAPVSPKLSQNLLLGATFGLFAAVLLCFALESLDDSVKSGAASEAATGLPTLGEVARRGRSLSLPFARQNAGSGGEAGSLLERLLAAPAEPADGSYGVMAAAIRYSASAPGIRSIVVTSPGAGEGKSTIATRLAAAMAQSGARVILADADLRRLQPAKLRQPIHAGLSGLLSSETVDVLPALVATEWPNLRLLPAGTSPQDPAAALASTAMARLIAALQACADVVIFDTPAAIGMPDALVLAARCDAAILVAEAGRTRVQDLKAAVRLLEQVRARTLGVVINKTRPRRTLASGGGGNASELLTGLGSAWPRRLPVARTGNEQGEATITIRATQRGGNDSTSTAV